MGHLGDISSISPVVAVVVEFPYYWNLLETIRKYGSKSILNDIFDLFRALGSVRNGFVFKFPVKWWYRKVEGSFLSPFHDHSCFP